MGASSGAHHVAALGDVDPDDAADRRIQHRASSPPPAAAAAARDGAWPGSGLASRVRSPCPWALARPRRGAAGAAVRPSTVHAREAGAGVFLRRSRRRGATKPVACLPRDGGFRAAPSARNIQGGPRSRPASRSRCRRCAASCSPWPTTASAGRTACGGRGGAGRTRPAPTAATPPAGRTSGRGGPRPPPPGRAPPALVELTEAEWARLRPLLPPRRPRVGRPRHDHRTVLGGILWVVRNRASWRDMPGALREVERAYKRYRLWSDTGLWERHPPRAAQRPRQGNPPKCCCRGGYPVSSGRPGAAQVRVAPRVRRAARRRRG